MIMYGYCFRIFNFIIWLVATTTISVSLFIRWKSIINGTYFWRKFELFNNNGFDWFNFKIYAKS